VLANKRLSRFSAGEKHSEIGSRCQYTMPGVNSVNPVEMLRILRVVYMHPPSAVIVDAFPASAAAPPDNSPAANGDPSGPRRSTWGLRGPSKMNRVSGGTRGTLDGRPFLWGTLRTLDDRPRP